MMTPAFVLIQSLSVCAPLPAHIQPVTISEPTAVYALSEFCCDYALASTVAGPAAFGTEERAQLRAAQQRTPELAALRAGFAPSNNEWGWIAIGALAVILIILL